MYYIDGSGVGGGGGVAPALTTDAVGDEAHGPLLTGERRDSTFQYMLKLI